ncbi:hypothetical protein REPUB_Repub13aG0053300 [Reevesia pubescens]
MSSTLFFIFLLYFFLLLSPPTSIIGTNSTAIIVGATRPLVSKSEDLVTFNPETGMKHGFRSQYVKNCLLEGFHRTSAPSRYKNDHSFGSIMCSTTSDISTKP